MGNQVYANNMEVSCKAADGKSICAMPDVCMTPPQTPATPPGVPIPYPITGMASDCSDGSSTVQISGQEVMLKNQSYFKKCTGDEAGSAPMKGVVSSSNTGKIYFIAWSMDVKIEGENVVRNLDMTTGNHACPIANEAVPWVYTDNAAFAPGGPCAAEADAMKGKCSSPSDVSEACCNVPQRQCVLVAKGKTESGCCDNHGKVGHHIPPYSTVITAGVPDTSASYNSLKCLCVKGNNHSVGTHGKNHHGINYLLKKFSEGENPRFTNNDGTFSGTLGDHCDVAAAVTSTQTNCSKACIKGQLQEQFGDKTGNTAQHNAKTTGGQQYGRLEDEDLAKLDNIQMDPAAPTPSGGT